MTDLASIVPTDEPDYDPEVNWRCPATEYADDRADRGHRFQSIFRTDPRDGDVLFCERCGRIRKVPR